MLIGYARVSTDGQNLDRQIAALRSAGCEKIFREKASGKAIRARPQLEKAIDLLGHDDVLVVAEWDRATRSMIDGITIMQRVAARDALIKVLDKPHLDLTTPIGRGLLAMLSAIAEDERERIIKRANEGRRQAKTRGVHLGRKPKLTQKQQTLARQWVDEGKSYAEVGDTLGVSKTTVFRLMTKVRS